MQVDHSDSEFENIDDEISTNQDIVLQTNHLRNIEKNFIPGYNIYNHFFSYHHCKIVAAKNIPGLVSLVRTQNNDKFTTSLTINLSHFDHSGKKHYNLELITCPNKYNKKNFKLDNTFYIVREGEYRRYNDWSDYEWYFYGKDVSGRVIEGYLNKFSRLLGIVVGVKTGVIDIEKSDLEKLKLKVRGVFDIKGLCNIDEIEESKKTALLRLILTILGCNLRNILSLLDANHALTSIQCNSNNNDWKLRLSIRGLNESFYVKKSFIVRNQKLACELEYAIEVGDLKRCKEYIEDKHVSVFRDSHLYYVELAIFHGHDNIVDYLLSSVGDPVILIREVFYLNLIGFAFIKGQYKCLETIFSHLQKSLFRLQKKEYETEEEKILFEQKCKIYLEQLNKHKKNIGDLKKHVLILNPARLLDDIITIENEIKSKKILFVRIVSDEKIRLSYHHMINISIITKRSGVISINFGPNITLPQDSRDECTNVLSEIDSIRNPNLLDSILSTPSLLYFALDAYGLRSHRKKLEFLEYRIKFVKFEPKNISESSQTVYLYPAKNYGYTLKINGRIINGNLREITHDDLIVGYDEVGEVLKIDSVRRGILSDIVSENWKWLFCYEGNQVRRTPVNREKLDAFLNYRRYSSNYQPNYNRELFSYCEDFSSKAFLDYQQSFLKNVLRISSLDELQPGDILLKHDGRCKVNKFINEVNFFQKLIYQSKELSLKITHACMYYKDGKIIEVGRNGAQLRDSKQENGFIDITDEDFWPNYTWEVFRYSDREVAERAVKIACDIMQKSPKRYNNPFVLSGIFQKRYNYPFVLSGIFQNNFDTQPESKMVPVVSKFTGYDRIYYCSQFVVEVFKSASEEIFEIRHPKDQRYGHRDYKVRYAIDLIPRKTLPMNLCKYLLDHHGWEHMGYCNRNTLGLIDEASISIWEEGSSTGTSISRLSNNSG